MRYLHHVFLRGAMALALLAFGGTGALLPPACKADAGDAPIAMSMAAADAVPSTRAPITRLVQVERAAC